MNEEIGSFLRSHEAEMFSLLEQLVLIQSSTANKAGLDRVALLIQDFFQGLPLQCTRHPQKQAGDHLVFSTPAADSKKSILISGHMDTVFPEDTDFNWYRQDREKVYGPGVIDMKGGLVVTMFAVRALAAQGVLETLPLVLFFNSDEETGSATSAPLLKQLAASACCGLVTECGGMDGQVVTGRRGKTGYHLEIKGKAGHAAFAGKDKASAILALCTQVQALEALNDQPRGIVVNVGRISGGIGANSVAERAVAEIDTRYVNTADGYRLQNAIEHIAATPTVAGTSTTVAVVNKRPVMEQSSGNRELFEHVRRQADKLGLPLTEEFRQGVSDASNIAAQGVPVLDGLGPIGEFDHSDREYMLKNSLVQRCQLLAVTLPSLASHYC